MTWQPSIEPPGELLEGHAPDVSVLAEWFQKHGIDPREAELCFLTRERQLLPCLGGRLDTQWVLVEASRHSFRLDTGSLAPNVQAYERRTVAIPATPSLLESTVQAVDVFIMIRDDKAVRQPQRSVPVSQIRTILQAGPFGRIAELTFLGNTAVLRSPTGELRPRRTMP